MDRTLVLAGLIALVGLGTLAYPDMARADGLDETDLGESHQGQFGVSAKVAFGYRGIFPYAGDGDYYCGNADPGELGDPCQGRSPASLDLGVEYRILDGLGLLFEVRFGIERDFGEGASESGPRQVVYAPGLRAYIRDAGGLKFFIGLQATIDTTVYPQVSGNDLGVRITPGLMLDPHRTVGLIAFFGPHVSWSRWLQFGMEGGLGIQARFP